MARFCKSLLPLLVLLTACQSTPFEPASEPSTQPVAIDNVLPVELSPYEQSQGRVSRDAKNRFRQAVVAMQAADWDDAKQKLLTLTVDYPTLSGPILNLGIVYEQLNDKVAAEKSYQQAIMINRDNLAAYHRYGVLLREQGRFSEAEAVYLQALDIWQKDAASHKNLAILYDIYMGRLDDALRHYQVYMTLTGQENRQAKGWIADLKRRIKAANTAAAEK